MSRWKLAGFVLVAIAIAAVAYGALLIRHGFSARDNPSAMEVYIAKRHASFLSRRQSGMRRTRLRQPLKLYTDEIEEIGAKDKRLEIESGTNSK